MALSALCSFSLADLFSLCPVYTVCQSLKIWFPYCLLTKVKGPSVTDDMFVESDNLFTQL